MMGKRNTRVSEREKGERERKKGERVDGHEKACPNMNLILEISGRCYKSLKAVIYA